MSITTTTTSTVTTTGATTADVTDNDDNAHDNPEQPMTEHRTPTTMRAAQRHDYGGVEAVSLHTVDTPTPGAGQVLVRVRAAGVDQGVIHMMTGLPLIARPMFGIRRPKQPTLGLDVAGTVVAIGPDVERLAVGDEVMGIADGSFAEYAVAEEEKLVHRPDGVAVDIAAVSPISGLTALQALTDVGRLDAGQRVLVLGASGGVGSFVVQLAHTLGARVTGVASGPKLDAVRAMGADEVVDYRVDDLSGHAGRYDLIIDIGGRRPVRVLRRLLEQHGTLVIVGGENGGRFAGGIGRQLWAKIVSPLVSQRLTFFISAEVRDDIQRVADHLAAGTVVPHIGERVALDDVTEALGALVAGDITGKAVIEVAGD